MAIDPNQFGGNPAELRMTPAPKEPEGDGEKQQAEYVEGTLPMRMIKMHPGAGYAPPPGCILIMRIGSVPSTYSA